MNEVVGRVTAKSMGQRKGLFRSFTTWTLTIHNHDGQTERVWGASGLLPLLQLVQPGDLVAYVADGDGEELKSFQLAPKVVNVMEKDEVRVMRWSMFPFIQIVLTVKDLNGNVYKIFGFVATVPELKKVEINDRIRYEVGSYEAGVTELTIVDDPKPVVLDPEQLVRETQQT